MTSHHLILALFGAALTFSSCSDCPTNKDVFTYEDGGLEKEIIWLNREDSSYQVITYRHGVAVGTDKIFLKGKLARLAYYYDTGELAALFAYHDDQPLCGAEYYRNGQKMGDVPREINGDLEGSIVYYYESGRVKAEGTYLDNEPNGLWTEYDENGNITEERTYEKGKLLTTTPAIK